MADLTVLYWRDIPSQVVARAGRRRQAKILLSDRFQQAIDRAAMKGGARGADAYLEEWRKGQPAPCADDLEGAAQGRAGEIEAAYDEARLAGLVSNGGRDRKDVGD